MVEPLRHRQTKGAETDMFDLQLPRHISTLPFSTFSPLTLLPLRMGADVSQPNARRMQDRRRSQSEGRAGKADYSWHQSVSGESALGRLMMPTRRATPSPPSDQALAFGEPAVDRSEKIASLTAFILIAPETRHAHCGAEFPGLGLLLTRNAERSLEICRRFRRSR